MIELSKDGEVSKKWHIPMYNLLLPIPVFLILNCFGIFPIWWAITHRTWDDFLRYSPFLGLAFILVSGKFAFNIIKIFWAHNLRIVALLLTVQIPFGLLIVGALGYCFVATTWDMLRLLYSASGTSYFGAITLMLFTLVTGLLLFLFRLRYRATYGFTEAIAGVCIAGYKFIAEGANEALTNPNFYLALLTAGIYLVVRGLDNIHQGLYKEPFDPIPRFLKKQLEIKDSRARTENSAEH